MDLSKWVDALEREVEVAARISCPDCGPESNMSAGQQAHMHEFDDLKEKTGKYFGQAWAFFEISDEYVEFKTSILLKVKAFIYDTLIKKGTSQKENGSILKFNEINYADDITSTIQ